MRTIARRLGFYLVTAIVAISLDFLLPRIIPGNPVDAILAKMQGVSITKQTISALELQFGINTKASLWAQYTHYLVSVLHGDFGISTSNGFAPVSSVGRCIPFLCRESPGPTPGRAMPTVASGAPMPGPA